MNTTPYSPVVRPVALSSILACIILAASLGLHAQPATAPAKKTAPALALTVDVSAAERVKPALPVIPDHTFNLADFGGVGDGRTMNTDAFKRALAAVEKAGGGKLVVPKGVFRTAPFKLCSNLDLHLADGAAIQAPDTFEALGIPHPSTFKTQAEANAVYRVPNPLISGSKLHDVALTGPGTIDGSGQHWWDWSERAARNAAKTPPGRIVYRRPHLVVIDGCDRLLVADLTLRNSSMFHLVPKRVNDLTITHLTLQDITLTAEKDFDIRDAEKPVFERVTRTIKPGVAPARIPGEH